MTEDQAEYVTEIDDANEMLGAGYSKTIVRVVKNADNPFVMMDKRPIENKELSWKAKGLLAYLLSRPDNWTIRMKDLVNRSTDGEHAVRAAMKELKEAGHIQMETERQKGKITKWTYTVYEVPIPDGDFQQVEKLQIENRTHTKIDSTKKDLSNSTTTPTKNIYQIYEEHIGSLVPIISDTLKAAEKDYSGAWIKDAIEIAVKRNARNWNFINAILKRWKSEGKDDGLENRPARKNGKGDQSLIEKLEGELAEE